MLHSRRLFLLLAFCLTILSLSQIAAHDETPTPTPSPTETAIPTLPPTETPTGIPSETPLPTITPTPLPSETLTSTETPTNQPTLTAIPSPNGISETATPTESPVPTVGTVTDSPSATETATNTPTATESATQPTFTPEPPLTLLFTDTFDTGSLVLWNLGTGWGLAAHDAGQALQAVNTDEASTFVHNTLNNAAVQTTFTMNTGMFRVSLRQSEVGAYTAILAINGELALYRGNQVIGTATLAPLTAGTWHTLRLSAINTILRVSVDGVEAIVTEDNAPLQSGMFSFAGIGNTSTLTVDDVSLWMPTSELQATATPSLTVTPTASQTPTSTPEAPEPNLRLLYSQSFDGRTNPFAELSRSVWPLKRVEPDYALYVTGAKRITQVTRRTYADVIAVARFLVSNGAGQLNVRQTTTDAYSASLNVSGQIELYRNSVLVQSVVVSTSVTGQWHVVRLSAVGDLIRVYVDNVEHIRFVDPSPLPDGFVTFNGDNLGTQPLLVDDLQVWIPDESVANVQSLAVQSQSLSPLSIEEPTLRDYLHRDEAYIFGYLGSSNSYHDGNGGGHTLSAVGSSPSISPNGQQIAYHCGGVGADICITDPNNTAYFNLTNDEAYDDDPSWSPDGTKIAFWSSREVNGDLTSGIWIMDANGSNLQLLTTISQGYNLAWVGTTANNAIYYSSYDGGIYSYSLSSNSTTLVASGTIGDSDYAVDSGGNHWVAYTTSDDDLVLHNLSQSGDDILYQHQPPELGASDDSGNIRKPYLSPDATRLTYSTDYQGIDRFGTYKWIIAVSNLSSGTPQLFGGLPFSGTYGIDDDWGYAPAPTPIPITGKLTYVKTSGGNKDVWVMENFTNQQTQLSNHPASDTDPELSPNGQYAAFVTERYGGGNKEIVVKPVADGLSDTHLQRLTNNNNFRDDNPTWSPDGQYIAFFSSRSPSGIWVMNADGSNPQPVLSGIYITDLSWSSVENELVYTDYDFENDSDGIFTVDINNPVPILLDGNLADDRQPAWSPDGEQITFTSNRDGRYNIYVMDADGSNVQPVTINSLNEDNVYPAWSPDGEQIVFTSFVPEFSTDAFYDYSATKTFLRIYEQDTAQVSSEMNLPVLSQGAAPQRLQSTTTWSPIPYYSAGQILDYTEIAWRSLQTQTPEQFCLSRPVTNDPLGLNIRPNPTFSSTPVNVHGGILKITGVYSTSVGRWLRVDPYINAGNLGDGILGWVWEDVFLNPCADGSNINTLPIMDDLGNIVALPTPVPTATPPAPPPTPQYPNPSCQGVHTANPSRLRAEPYTDSVELQFIEGYQAVNIHSRFDFGSNILGSTVWYQVGFVRGTGEQAYGWMHQSVLDQNELNQLCQSVPSESLATRTPAPTLTPTPSSTPPPDLSDIFPLPMIGLGGEPARLTNAGCELEYTYPIPSRDVNPLGRNDAGHPLLTSAQSTIMVVDRAAGGDPGVFVSFRIAMADIPLKIRQRLATMNAIPDNTQFSNIPVDATGSLHIAYSHLSTGSIPSSLEPAKLSDGIQSPEIILSGTTVGLSGDTGRAFGPHLDVAIFYIPDDGTSNIASELLDAVHFEGYPGIYFENFRYKWDAFWTMYDEARRKPDLYGAPVVVNPLVLWPSLQDGTGCSFY